MKYEIRLSGADQNDGELKLDPPVKLNIEKQIQNKLKYKKHVNHLGDIVGQWPGDESIGDILKDLD